MLHDGEEILIVLYPLFSNELDKDEYPILIEYTDLPIEVQNEVLQYFQSETFIEKWVLDYVTKKIAAADDTYPKFNTFIDNLDFKLYGDALEVSLYGTLVEVATRRKLQTGYY